MTAQDRFRPRVVHVSQPVEAGVAQCVLAYATDQVRRGWPVTVVCPPESWLARGVAAAGADVVAWPAGREIGTSSATETARLRRLLQPLRPELVHLHSSKAGLAGRLALRGRVPTVFQPHAWSFETLSGPVRQAAQRWERTGARWSDAILCVSDAERATGIAAGIRARYEVIANGVDLRAVPVADGADRSAARRRLGLGEAPLAVCLGRLSHQKGQDTLLPAWTVVRDLIPAARLALVGDGPLATELASRMPPDAGITLHGYSRQAPDWLAAADVVLCPSRYEGMALVPLEAMARGRSVVVSDIAPNRESVPEAAGAIVDVTDPAALAGAVARRLQDAALARAEGLAGRAHVEAHHDLDAVLGHIASLYARVVGTATRG